MIQCSACSEVHAKSRGCKNAERTASRKGLDFWFSARPFYLTVNLYFLSLIHHPSDTHYHRLPVDLAAWAQTESESLPPNSRTANWSASSPATSPLLPPPQPTMSYCWRIFSEENTTQPAGPQNLDPSGKAGVRLVLFLLLQTLGSCVPSGSVCYARIRPGKFQPVYSSIFEEAENVREC